MRLLPILSAVFTLGALAACKPESQAEKYSTDSLRRFEAEQAPKLEKREERLEEAKVEKKDSADKKMNELSEHIEEERAENYDEHADKLAELEGRDAGVKP